MGMRTVFLENRRFLLKYGHERSSFFVKIWKKIGVLLTFLAYNSSVVLTELTFFDQIWAWQKGIFHDKFVKKMTVSVFLREWTFF